MSEKNDQSIIEEVESRLDALFKENDQFQSLDFEEDSEDPEDYPLKELKGIVLSLDWEISDEIMAKFAEEIGRLNNRYKDNTILLMFLKILLLVGKYIVIKKARAHPSAIKVFNSAFIHLDIVVSSKGMTDAEKKKILFKEIAKFNELKEEIALAKTAAPRGVEVVPSEEREFAPEEEVTAPEQPPAEMPLEEEKPEEVEFVPEEKEIPIEEPRVEISIEERLAEEVEFAPEEEVTAPEQPPAEMPLEEEEPEEIEFVPEEEEITLEELPEEMPLEEEEPEEIELVPEEEEITLEELPEEMPLEEEEPEEIEFVPDEKEMPIEEPRVEIPVEEVEFAPEEKEMPIEEPRVEIPIEERLAEEVEFASEEKVIAPEEPTEEEKVDLSALPPHEAFAYALEEMQDVIKAEFKAIRTELKLWKEGQ